MESLYLFPLYVLLLLCACVLLRQLYQLVRGQNTSWRSTLLTGFALIPLLAMVCHLVWPSGTDYNPRRRDAGGDRWNLCVRGI